MLAVLLKGPKPSKGEPVVLTGPAPEPVVLMPTKGKK